jgi:hypothetical protein
MNPRIASKAVWILRDRPTEGESRGGVLKDFRFRYFRISIFAAMAAIGEYFLSRLQYGTGGCLRWCTRQSAETGGETAELMRMGILTSRRIQRTVRSLP